jgi:hypothetical protein
MDHIDRERCPETGFWEIAPCPLMFNNPSNLQPSNSLKT